MRCGFQRGLFLTNTECRIIDRVKIDDDYEFILEEVTTDDN